MSKGSISLKNINKWLRDTWKYTQHNWLFLNYKSNPNEIHFTSIRIAIINVMSVGAAAAAKSLQSCPTLCDPKTVAHQAPPSLGFSRQKHWSGLQFPFPGNIPDPGIKPRSPTLQADALPSEPSGKLSWVLFCFVLFCFSSDKAEWSGNPICW